MASQKNCPVGSGRGINRSKLSQPCEAPSVSLFQTIPSLGAKPSIQVTPQLVDCRHPYALRRFKQALTRTESGEHLNWPLEASPVLCCYPIANLRRGVAE